MRLTWRDTLATIFVLAGAILYLLWLADIEVVGISSARAVGGVVMVLGLAASVTAVVYGVGAGLMQAPKVYLVVTSLLGLAALVAGIFVLTDPSESMLGLLVASTVVLWLMSTVRHALVHETGMRDGPSRLTFTHAA